MESDYWKDTDEHPDRKRKRQVEFLIHESVPIELFLGIGVRSEQMKKMVDEILRTHGIEMTVLVRPSFYY